MVTKRYHLLSGVSLRFGAIAAVFLALSCSLQTPAPPVKPLVIPQGSASPADAEVPKPRMVALRLQEPLFSDPRLQEAKRELEHGEDEKALSLFEEALSRLETGSQDEARWHLWLGYAYQKRSQCLLALAHFQAAASGTWPLKDYASLGIAQCQLALGRLEEARLQLDSAKFGSELEDESQRLKAEVASQLGDGALAIVIWRDYLKAHPLPSVERTAIRVALAEALIRTVAAETSLENADAAVGTQAPIDETLNEAFALLDSISPRDLDRASYDRVYARRTALIGKLFETDALRKQECTVRNQAEELEALIEKHDFRGARNLAAATAAELEQNGLLQTPDGCRIQFADAQAHFALGEKAKGMSVLEALSNSCSYPEDTVARALYTMARHFQEQKEWARAIAAFESLERRFPKHGLVDDARLKIAYAYLELGSESQFTQCIQRLVEDFPESELAGEGLFQLALRAMSKSDWSASAVLLSQLGRLPRIAKRTDVEQSERQIYFFARSQSQLGQTEVALDAYERLIRERPFSYYMLASYSRLMEANRSRALRVHESSCSDNGETPLSVPYQPQFDTPGYSRAVELMALGEVQRGAKELKLLQLPSELEPLLLWARATFEANSGSLKNSQRLVRERMQDWPRRWPAGAWEPAWRIAYPRPFLEIVARESKRTAVPESLIYSIMREESQFDREAVSPADAYGLMQLIVPTAKRAAKSLGMSANASSLLRPGLNVALGSQVLSGLLKTFDKLPLLAIPAYNAGPGRPSRWLKERPNLDFDVWVEAIPFAETRIYMKHVLASWATYAWLYDREHSEPAMKLPLRMVD